MSGLYLHPDYNAALRILCLGAHSDDIEIGCGGTILKLTERYPRAKFHWVVFGGNQPQRAIEAESSAKSFLLSASDPAITVKGFRDSFFPYIGTEIKEYFEGLKNISPDVIFTHHRNDLHQDHRLICELTWNTFRNHTILEYEIPKYDGDLGAPNCFVHLDEATCRKKISLILGHFQSQLTRDWFTEDTFFSLLRLRGVESASPSRYAEAFYGRKLVIK